MQRLFLFLSIICLNGCNNTQKDGALYYPILSESLETSTSLIKIQSREKYNLLKEQLEDPRMSEKTAYWMPNAEKIMHLSDRITNYIETIKQNATIKSDITNYLHPLYDSLASYQSSVLNVESE